MVPDRHEESEVVVEVVVMSLGDSSGIYICKLEENDLKHGNYILNQKKITKWNSGAYIR